MLIHFFLFIGVSFATEVPSDPLVAEFLKNTESLFISHPTRSSLSNHYYRTKQLKPVAVLFVPGMGEPALKYHELQKDFQNQDVTLYVWDHIGQGKSTHLTPKDSNKIHIDDFKTHLEALENFLKELKKNHSKVFVLAHSMGGHITLQVALAHPGLIDKLVLSSPMIEMNLENLPVRFLRWLFDFFPADMYIPFYYFVKPDGARMNGLTHSSNRFAVYKKLEKEFPEIKRSSGTVGWVLAALKSQDKLRKLDFSNFTQKVLILQAEKDVYVSNKAQKEFCQKLPHCRLETIPGSYHELFFEEDFARSPALSLVRDEFFTPL